MAGSVKSQNQLSEEFTTEFNKKKGELTDQINSLTSKESSVAERLTTYSSEIQKLSKLLHDASMYLPSYSVKIRQTEVHDLEKLLKNKEDELIPKKKFGFKSTRAPAPSVIPSDPNISRPQITCDDQHKTTSIASKVDNFFTIESINGETIHYEEGKLNGNDVLVKDCENAVIRLFGGPSTLRLANLKNCKLLCGPVRTSVFVDQVEKSVLFLCCHQLRTHSSENVDIYLRVRSRAIIEDCKKIRFGPYNWEHEKSEDLHKKAEISVRLERYDAVDDFNWLSSTPSPNWTIIPTEEVVSFDSS